MALHSTPDRQEFRPQTGYDPLLRQFRCEESVSPISPEIGAIETRRPEWIIVARKRTWLEWLNPFSRFQRWFTFFAIVWLLVASYLLYRAFTTDGIKLSATFAIYLLATVVCSSLAFVLYGLDKRSAIRDKPRISERTLHLLSVFGGWPGAHLARITFRHKTLKVSFRVVFWVIVMIHLTLITYCMLFGWWVDSFKALTGI
jgi:uncharacterized membrane protein YsdA (DUF1294 family)